MKTHAKRTKGTLAKGTPSVLFAGDADEGELWLRRAQAALLEAGVPCEIEWTSGYLAIPGLNAFPQVNLNDEGACVVDSVAGDARDDRYFSRRPSPARVVALARAMLAQV